jgi:transposase-like protein
MEGKKMAYKKITVVEDVKKKYVRMALETGNHTSIARKAGIDRSTLKKWVNEYQDDVRDQMEKDDITILSDEPTQAELQKKYDQALKLLGEKELEVALLREIVKKNASM